MNFKILISILMIISQNIFANDRIINASCNIWGKLKVKAITEQGDEVQYTKDFIFNRRECNRIKNRIKVEAPLISTNLRTLKKFEIVSVAVPDRRPDKYNGLPTPGAYTFKCEVYEVTEYFLDTKLSDSTSFTLVRKETKLEKNKRGECSKF